MKYSITLLLFLSIATNAVARRKDHLAACWQKQVAALAGGFIHLYYNETDHEIAHLSEPWASYHIAAKGSIWGNEAQFLKCGTVNKWGRTYYSKTQADSSTLLYVDYGGKELSKVTSGDLVDEVFAEAKYAPCFLIGYFHKHDPVQVKDGDKGYAIYTLTINKTIVNLYINKKTDLLEKIITLANHDQYGDVSTTVYYSNYLEINTLSYPARMEINKINGKVKDTITISSATITKTAVPLLEQPTDYKFAEEKVTKPELSVEKYNDHIHFITLHHTNGRSIVVEFDSFLLVAEAPLNSENGELIIKEAKKIAPGKPIRYFVFGHYHPDYTGGMRAFIKEGSTILCTNGDLDYVRYLAAAPHTLQPDSLQLHPALIHTEDVGIHKTISDGKYIIDICFIGGKSEHTKDYLIYYFPQEKMIFEGDLTWISDKGTIMKAGKTQRGLYNAIKDLGLDVVTIEQSWPVSGYDVKSEIPFSDMEAAMK